MTDRPWTDDEIEALRRHIAKAAGAELLARFPMLRVEVYNAETKIRTKV